MNPFEKDLPVLKLDWNSVSIPDMKQTRGILTKQSPDKEIINTAITMYNDERRDKKYNDILMDNINKELKTLKSSLNISFKSVEQTMVSLNQETLRVISRMNEQYKTRFEDLTVQYHTIQNTIIDYLTMAKLDTQSLMESLQESFKANNKALVDQFMSQFELLYETIKITTDDLRIQLENIKVQFSEIHFELDKYQKGILDEWKKQLEIHSDVYDSEIAKLNLIIEQQKRLVKEVQTKYAELQARYAELQSKMDRARVHFSGYSGNGRYGTTTIPVSY